MMKLKLLTLLAAAGSLALAGAAYLSAKSQSSSQVPPSSAGGRTAVAATRSVADDNDSARPPAGLTADPVEEVAGTEPSPTQRSFGLLMSALAKARQILDDIPGYYAVLEKQVFVDGRLHDTEVIDIKVRHEPFSVYLKWRADQQEVLYVDGQHDGRLLVHPTRGIISLRKVWRLPPDSPQAMKKNRHPVTSLGILRLHDMIDGFHQERGYSMEGLECRMYEENLEGQTCLRVETVFASPQEGGEFSRSIVTICPKSELVIGVENYGWTKDNRPGPLLEKYLYRDISVQPVPREADFEMNNSEYNFL